MKNQFESMNSGQENINEETRKQTAESEYLKSQREKSDEEERQKKIDNIKKPEQEKHVVKLNNVARRDVTEMKSYIMRFNKENKISIPFAIEKVLTGFGYKDPVERKIMKKIILDEFREKRKENSSQLKIKFPKDKKSEGK